MGINYMPIVYEKTFREFLEKFYCGVADGDGLDLPGGARYARCIRLDAGYAQRGCRWGWSTKKGAMFGFLTLPTFEKKGGGAFWQDGLLVVNGYWDKTANGYVCGLVAWKF